MSILEVSGYTKSFHIHHLNREIPVFDALDFRLNAGEFLLVTGPNGIGKSTLLRCLYRSYRPTSGAGALSFPLRHGRSGARRRRGYGRFATGRNGLCDPVSAPATARQRAGNGGGNGR